MATAGRCASSSFKISPGNSYVVRVEKVEPPRRFRVGKDNWVEISDCAHVFLEKNEMVRIAHADGTMEWPVVRRRWGFCLPLPLDRATQNGLRAVLSGKDEKRCHLLFFDPRHERGFLEYEDIEDHQRFANLSV